MKKFLAYTIPIILSLAVGAIGSFIQSPSITTWYPTLTKSMLTPPAIVFPIVWTILYVLMGEYIHTPYIIRSLDWYSGGRIFYLIRL